MVNFSMSKTLAAAIAILAGGMAGFYNQAIAASGTINIQTVPEGAKFTIVERRGLKIVAGGITPYFDMAFPTGKYTVCFQLDGYLTAWQHSYVQTSSSAWIGPVMKPSNNVAQSTCEEIIARVRAEKEEVRAALLQQLSAMEPISWSTGNSGDVPASAPGGQGVESYETHETDRRLDGQILDNRRERVEDNRAEKSGQGTINPSPVIKRR